jgi:hypothetical protein
VTERDAERPSLKIPGSPISELPWSADFVMQAIELLPVSLADGELIALKPDCADSFVVGWPAGARPEDIAARAIESLGMRPIVLHSTSWRHSGNEVVLTYLVVVPEDAILPESWEIAPIAHTQLARGDATTPPPVIGVSQVLEHALRHLAWLVREDEQIGAALPGWDGHLASYVPEPFRALGGPGLEVGG